jgi:hypothetical protein
MLCVCLRCCIVVFDRRCGQTKTDAAGAAGAGLGQIKLGQRLGRRGKACWRASWPFFAALPQEHYFLLPLHTHCPPTPKTLIRGGDILSVREFTIKTLIVVFCAALLAFHTPGIVLDVMSVVVHNLNTCCVRRWAGGRYCLFLVHLQSNDDVVAAINAKVEGAQGTRDKHSSV